MLQHIAANKMMYKVTNPNIFDNWGLKCFQADEYTSDGMTWYECINPTFIPLSCITGIEIHNFDY